MEGTFQQIAAFLCHGAKTFWGWLSFAVLRLYAAVDQLLYENHSLCAAVVVALILALVVLALWNFIWPRKLGPAQPGQPPAFVRRPQAYRLLAVSGILVIIFCAACFVGS